ncbi:MAG: NUDIX domain-containing protein [Ignavibacteria bacterium]
MKKQVVVGILMNADKQVFIAQRSASGTYPLKWEFPGGKVEEDESFEEALKRELNEELGYEIHSSVELFHSNDIIYDDGGVFSVRFYIVRCELQKIESTLWEEMKYEQIQNLHLYDMLEGNREVVKLLQEHYS